MVIPGRLVMPKPGAAPAGFAEDAMARQAIERAAMDAVMAAERALGRTPRDVSAAKVGYDIESSDSLGSLHFIEVKGRIQGGDTITVTTNEMLVALNSGDRFVLAIVPVGEGGFSHQPIYIRRPFDRAPDPDACATVFKLDALTKRGTGPC